MACPPKAGRNPTTAEGQVKDLPSLWVKLTDHVRQRCPTGQALRRRMDAPLIRDGHLVQPRAWMARLAAGLSA